MSDTEISVEDIAAEPHRRMLEDCQLDGHVVEQERATAPIDQLDVPPAAMVVSTPDDAAAVLLDRDENYSVCGYNERGATAFGEIYLGLDAGDDYTRQSTAANAAISAISRKDAFELTLREARKVFADDPRATPDLVRVKVLAAICKEWFDLPDERNVITGPIRLSAERPVRCPGDYALPSNLIFLYEPREPTLSAAIGRELRAATKTAVAEYRESNTRPKGRLSRAIFDSFDTSEDDLLSRTIVGVMIGLLPTVSSNLQNTHKLWIANDNEIFRKLRAAIKEHSDTDTFARASDVLSKPMMHAMQRDPMPPEVWRTARKAHTIAGKEINPGDTVRVHIKAATNADLAAGKTDVFTVFGGDRSKTPHPTHACPGYEASMGIMLAYHFSLLEA